MCICTSLAPCVSLSFSLNTSLSVWLYCHWLFTYRGTSLDPRFSLSFSLSVSVSGYSIGNSMCIHTSLGSYFFLCLWMCRYQCPAILSITVGFDVRLLIRVSLSLFLWMFLSVFGYIVTDCICIGTSLDPRFSHSLSFCLSQCAGIWSVICMYVNKRVDLDQRVIAI